ncbi:MAG: hypothetical protein IKV39_03460, partial [Clostridia bacterium]|nr:hypothetical protein [Clostridia bacterium]
MHEKQRRGFLRGRIREVAVEFLEIAIIGGIQSLESISNIIYPVLLPLKWTVIHKRCGHGTPLVRPTRSAKKYKDERAISAEEQSGQHVILSGAKRNRRIYLSVFDFVLRTTLRMTELGVQLPRVETSQTCSTGGCYPP